MGKYINADQLFQCETCFHHQGGKCDAWCDHGEAYRPAMNKLKIVDAEEVVRCKDCKHATFYACKNDACYRGIICEYQIGTDDENFFCSYGERRTDDDL